MLPRSFRLIALTTGLAAVSWTGRISAAELPARYQRVDVAPTKTSVYIGSVSMTMPPLVRVGGSYETAYAAKVFPFFFYNESGSLTIDISDDRLRAVDRGEAIEFKGRGVSAAGEERRVEGKVTPTSATEGKIKVRVFVSKRIELIFNTTYRLAGEPAKVGPSATAENRP
ncbi:MAG: hypothetical protein ABIQ12_09220 [Opitutaceae bacterium]